MRTAVRRVALALVAVLAPAGVLRGQDAPPPLAPVPAPKPAPEDPPKKVAKDIETALQEFFDLDPSTTRDAENIAARSNRSKAFGAIYEGMKAWNARLGDDSCLRRVDWWRAALLQTYPTSEPKKKIYPLQVEDPLGGPSIGIVVNIPNGYRGKGGVLYPVVLTSLEKGADPRKTLETVYGPLLNTHIVAAVPEESAGTDRFKLLRGLDYVLAHFRADHHRVTLDGPAKGNHFVDTLGAELPVLFNGVVFRGPTTVSPLVANLAYFPCAVGLPSPANEALTQAAEAIKAACPETTTIQGLGTPAADTQIQDWITALPPRAVRDHGKAFSWWGASLGSRQTWGYWTFAQRTVDAARDLPVMIRTRFDRALNLVDIEARNLAIGLVVLNDEMLDLDHPVVIRVNGIVVLTQTVTRDLSWMFGNEGLFNDPRWPRDHFVTAGIAFEVTGNARLTREERDDLERQRKEAEEEMERQRKAAEEGEKPAGEAPAPADAPAPAEAPAPVEAPAKVDDPAPADAPAKDDAPAPPPPASDGLTDFEAARKAGHRDGKVFVALLKAPPGAEGAKDPFQEALLASLQEPGIAARLAAGCVRFETTLTPETLTPPLKEFLGEKAGSVKPPLLVIQHPGDGGKRVEIGPDAEWKPEEVPAKLKAALEEALPAAPDPKPAPGVEEGKAPAKDEPGAEAGAGKPAEGKPAEGKPADAEPK